MEKILKALEAIPVSQTSYTEWINVGTALKTENYDCSLWDNWSRHDPRYKAGDCARRWPGLREGTVTGGTIVYIAKQYGYDPSGGDSDRVAPGITLHRVKEEPSAEKPKAVITLEEQEFVCRFDEVMSGTVLQPYPEDLEEVLEICCRPDDNINIVTRASEAGGKYRPAGSGNQYRVSNINAYEILRSINAEAGAWVRMNPTDGAGVCDADIEDFRFALIECDDIPIRKQEEMYRRLRLPIAALIFSGGKSLHAWVKVNAATLEEYRERTLKLYDICERCGLKPDPANKNASRLSRLPGAVRGDTVQRLIDTDIGCQSWDEWMEFIEGCTVDEQEGAAMQEKAEHREAASAHTEQSAAAYMDTFKKIIKDPTPPISTGFKELDRAFDDGLYRENVYYIGAESSAGKTALVMQIADQIAAAGTDVLVFSCEMGKAQLIARSVSRITFDLSRESGHGSNLAKTAHDITGGHRYKDYGAQDKQIIESAITQYENQIAQHIYIFEGNGGTTVNDVRKEVQAHREIKQENFVVVVDYLQIMAAPDPHLTDKQVVDLSAKVLKQTARDCHVPIICISSFNRDGYEKPVTMKNFKESGGLEYGADTLVGLQLVGIGRDDFCKEQLESVERGEARQVELKIIKGRDSEKYANVRFDFYPHFSKFTCGEFRPVRGSGSVPFRSRNKRDDGRL